MHRRATHLLVALLSFGSALGAAASDAADHWFERFKDEADDDTLLRFLHAMPKGGDLHMHLGGSNHPEWLWEIAVDAERWGYRFLTRTRFENCSNLADATGDSLLLFRTITEHSWRQLPACERREYTPLKDLGARRREAWMNAMRLDRPGEGRDEFFDRHWDRMGQIGWSPEIMAETLVYNMKAFGDDGALYLEPGISVEGYRTPDGEPIAPERVVEILRARLAEPDAVATGVTVRFELAVLRFLPSAEDDLRFRYAFVAARDDFVSVDLVGREDDDKGYPARFLDTFRELRRTHGDVSLSIHGGEVDEPNAHVRDTLLLGADRIGHGVNLITDPDTMLLMKGGPWMVEINLISNLLLEYVDDYADHPFPEYLRFGIPVALSTDDRGMWDSTLSDEFFVAVREFDLTWEEILLLSRNSLRHAFVEPAVKARLLTEYERRIANFERTFREEGLDAVERTPPQYRGFLCRQYRVCAP